MRTCTIDGCDRAHRARGLCTSHYNQAHQPNRHRKVEQACAACGATVVKVKSGARRPVCSDRCRYFVTWGRWPERSTELVGPLPRYCVLPPRPSPSTRTRFVDVTCDWCDLRFIHDMRVTGVVPRFCTLKCSTAHHKTARRLRQGRFAITPRERHAIYERDGWTCQLCQEPVDPTLPTSHRWAATLDHIECQSWTLIPDHSPTNLRLAHRMCNSVRSDRRISPAA